MKGFLESGQLKSMKYEELQALAKAMGISAGGKKEELIVRIASIEVDAPAENAAAVQETRGEPSRTALVEITTKFRDKQLNQIKDAGEVYEVSPERAKELEAASVAVIRG